MEENIMGYNLTKNKYVPHLYLIVLIGYLINKILLYQADVHLSTSGAIRNTEMWDFKMMLESGLLSGKNLYISLVLFSGIIVTFFLTRLISKLQNTKNIGR